MAGSQRHHEMSFEPGVLYAVLEYRGDQTSWHWAFFIPNPAATPIGVDGAVFDAAADRDKQEWRFETRTRDVVRSSATVLIAKLAELSTFGEYSAVRAELEVALRPVHAPVDTHCSVFSCRTLFLEGIRALNDAGFVDCGNIAAFEKEITLAALRATNRYSQNEGWSLITSGFCT